LIKTEVQAGGRDFFERTEVYEKEYVIPSVADQEDYDVQAEVVAGEHVEVVRVISVWPADWAAPIPTAKYEVSHAGVVTLDTALTEDDVAITFSVVLVPRANWTAIDGTYWGRYRDGIRAKALAELYGLPQRPWSDDRQAAEWMAEYVRRCGVAKGNRLRRNKNVQLCASPRRFL